MGHYATQVGERGPFGWPFALVESPLTGIPRQGENALRVSEPRRKATRIALTVGSTGTASLRRRGLARSHPAVSPARPALSQPVAPECGPRVGPPRHRCEGAAGHLSESVNVPARLAGAPAPSPERLGPHARSALPPCGPWADRTGRPRPADPGCCRSAPLRLKQHLGLDKSVVLLYNDFIML